MTISASSLHAPKTSLIDTLAGDLLLKRSPINETTFGEAADIPRDYDWVKQSFLVTVDQNDVPLMDDNAYYSRDATTAELKFTDSSLGGNICINPPPQLTRYADIRVPGIHLQGGVNDSTNINNLRNFAPNYVDVTMNKDVTSYGMGSYYNEAFDENNQIIHMRFGVPAFNSLIQFFTGFYDTGMATVARTGRISGTFINRFLAFTGNLIGLAIAPLALIPMAIMLLGTAARFFANTPPTKFYYLKPAMPVYWTAVTNMVNQIGTNMGLISYIDTRQSKITQHSMQGINTNASGQTNQVGIISKYLPDDMLREDGLIDVKKIACRAKILEQKFQSVISQAFDKTDGSSNFADTIKNSLGNLRSEMAATSPVGFSLEKYLTQHFLTASYGQSAEAPGSDSSVAQGAAAGVSNDNTGATELDLRATATRNKETGEPDGAISKYIEEVATYFIANLADGSDWASFRVDYTGAVSESFSSGVSESPLASKINSMSSQNRQTRLSFADGNIAPGVDTLINGVKSLLGGVAEILHIDGIASIAGSAFVDIPKNWDSSTANLPHSNYTMTLSSPYGNPVSQMFHIWIPLCMLLCGALPLATGAQSHTSPFLCELHDRGRTMTRLGLIDNISITRGTSNLAFNNRGHVLALDVSFSVLDLSGVMSVPVMPGFDLVNPLRGVFDSDNTYSDYLMTLASMPLADVIYRFPILKYQINRRIAEYKSALSPANVGSYIASFPGVNMLSAVMRGVDMP